MKKILKTAVMSLLVGGAMLTAASCTNLDENLYDTLSEENVDLSNPDDLSLVLGQAIANYRYMNTSWMGLWEFREECSDQYMIPVRPEGWGAMYVTLHQHTWNYNLNHGENCWGFAYVGIGYANQVLDNIPEDDLVSRAQPRFFRAMIYYDLFDMYRNVPFMNTAKVEQGYVPEQIGQQELYDFIVKEFEDIKDVIGTEKKYGWGNKYAVCMALAKLYLNHNAWFGTNDNTWYEKALAEVETVINEGGYSLAANYKDNFREDLSENPEIIFAIPEDRTHANHFQLHMIAFPQSGLAAYGSTGAAYNGSCAVPQWIDTYDPDDKRLADTWAMGEQHKAKENADGTWTANPADGEPIYDGTDDWTGTGILTYNKEVHSINNTYHQEGYRLHKYEILGGVNNGTMADDMPIFRLADAMFIKAECLLRLGRDEQTAAALVTQVRQRSFASTAKATRSVSQLKGGSVYEYGHREFTGEGATNWSESVTTYEGGSDIELGGLLDDLGWEFCCEHHRRQDLIRFKMADGRNVFNGKSWFCKDAVTDNHCDIFPIPEAAMRTNLKLKQNPGYSGAE